MRRRQVLTAAASMTVAALAGCATDVGADNPDETVVREDNGVEVANLEVFSEGSRDCYHTLEATVTNTNNAPIQNVDITILISDENDQILSEFETGYTEIGAGESKDLQVEHGPQKNQCWFSGDADDYTVTVNYDTA